jgi:CBS domain-containing protein
MIQVSDLLRGKSGFLWSIDASATLKDTLNLLSEKDIGALPVLSNGKLVGIFSERDFVRVFSNNPTLPLESRVSEFMTKNVLTVTPLDSVERCMKLMTEQHIRHLPVLDGDKMVGMVSIGDAVKLFVTDRESFIRQLEDYISGRW